LKIGLLRAQELFIGRGRFSWGGGGLHFSNWRRKKYWALRYDTNGARHANLL